MRAAIKSSPSGDPATTRLATVEVLASPRLGFTQSNAARNEAAAAASANGARQRPARLVEHAGAEVLHGAASDEASAAGEDATRVPSPPPAPFPGRPAA